MGRIYLARHGQVESNRANAYIGSTDLPLNDAGRHQAQLIADRLEQKDISAVYSSDLARARDTAEVLASRLGLPVKVVSELRELDYGEWENMPEVEVPERYGDVFHGWLANPVDVRVPGGETVRELMDRAWPALLRIAETCVKSNAFVVAHKCVNRVLICLILGIDPNSYRQIGQGNVALNVIEVRQDGRLVVDQVNDMCHVVGGV